MTHQKTGARITGVLFILGTATGVAAAILLGPVLSAPQDLSRLAADQAVVLTAALLIAFMGFACAGIGASLYPVLKGHGEALAAAVAGFRFMEGTLQVVTAAVLVSLLALGQQSAGAGSPADPLYAAAGGALRTVYDWMGNSTAVFPWCIAAFLYYGVFYRTRLVPRWLSVWGMAGLVLFLTSVFAVTYGLWDSRSPVQGFLAVPIAVQEMVLALWLIVKGYRE